MKTDFSRLYAAKVNPRIAPPVPNNPADNPENTPPNAEFILVGLIFKWLFIKSNTFENSISEITINRFKNVLKRTNKTSFSLIDIYKLSSEHCICLHCVIVEILQSNIFKETQFIKKLKVITENNSS